MSTALLVLGAVGLTLIVTIGDITRSLRRWKLFRCGQCTGFWVGMALASVREAVSDQTVSHASVLRVALVAGSVSVCAHLAQLWEVGRNGPPTGPE